MVVKKKLLALGGVYVDINCTRFPLPDSGLPLETETVGNNYELAPGGSAPNFARLCASLELPTTFVGKIGNDRLGHILTELMQAAGVEPACIIDENVTTNISINLVNDRSQSIMAVAGTANQSLEAGEVTAHIHSQLQHLDYLYLGGCFKLKKLLPAFERLAADAKAAGVKLVLDHARITSDVTAAEMEVVKNLALQADFYFPSNDEFCQLWGAGSIEVGLQSLSKLTNGTIIVKDAERGAVTIAEGEIVRVPAFKVQPINTVGAGDSFNAGFIAGAAQGLGLRESIQLGCAVAALKISRTALPTLTEARALVRTGQTAPLVT